jgi:hypothetical protein
LKKIKSIGTLKSYAFIRERTEHNSYDMHRLVQLALRNWLKKEKKLNKWSIKALERVAEDFPFFQHENKDKCTLLHPHTQYFLKYQENRKILEILQGQCCLTLESSFIRLRNT